jgi:hypothetical protein
MPVISPQHLFNEAAFESTAKELTEKHATERIMYPGTKSDGFSHTHCHFKAEKDGQGVHTVTIQVNHLNRRFFVSLPGLGAFMQTILTKILKLFE